MQEKSYVTVNSKETLKELIDHINSSELVAYDTETNSLNPRKGSIIGFSVSGEIGKGYYTIQITGGIILDKPFKIQFNTIGNFYGFNIGSSIVGNKLISDKLVDYFGPGYSDGTNIKIYATDKPIVVTLYETTNANQYLKPQPLYNKIYYSSISLCDAINNILIFTFAPGGGVVVLSYNDEKGAYQFDITPNTLTFTIEFNCQSSLGAALGFTKSTLQGSNKYVGQPTPRIENNYNNNSIYICSDLVNSIDSGSIIPAGGSLPINNVMFSIPGNAGDSLINNTLESTGVNEVLINGSKFAQLIREKQYNSDGKIPIRFWIQIPGGIGYVKKEWYMRTQLSFQNIV
jgi:hypothetical protein